MAGWSRREVLAALAAAGAAPAWAGLLGCGGARVAVAPVSGPPAVQSVGDLREQLVEVAAELGRRFRSVAVRAEVGQLTRAVVEPDERRFEERRRGSLILAGFDGSRWIEQVTSELGRDGIARAAAALGVRRSGSGGSGSGTGTGLVSGSGTIGSSSGSPEARGLRSEARPASEIAGPRLRIEPRGRGSRVWLERVAGLFERAARVGGSRIVYRAASLEVDDSEVLFVGDRGRDVAQRLVRTRARVLFLGWTGSALAGEEAARAGAFGLEASELPGAELERAAEGALTLLTGGRIAAGERDLLLDPSVAALLVRHGAGRGFEADAWARGARAAGLEGRAGAASAVTLRDDPTAPAAYGGYRFDDEGWPAAPVTLIERGVVRGPLCDAASAAALRRPRTGHGRRGGPLDPVEPRPSHLVLAPGTRDREELVAAVQGQGFLIEGGVEGSGDAQSWRVAVRARRAREIEGGRLTGRVYGPVVIAGSVPALLGAVRALDRSPEVQAWREAGRSGALASSVAAPALLTRGWLGGG
ncbi:MAG TPA: metallopeptidase TldD-related protein [Kofleriaceae bacterium]|nr:metallopeptidase TldD-related protein [Kofleriaceae bacterium]